MVDVSFQNGPLDVLIFGQVVLLILTPEVKVTQTPAREGLDTTPVFSLGNYDFPVPVGMVKSQNMIGKFLGFENLLSYTIFKRNIQELSCFLMFFQ